MRFKGMLILLLLASLFNASAIAGCTFAPTADYPANSIKKMTVPLAASAISVPPGTAVGATVYRQRITITSGASGVMISCDNVDIFQYLRGYKTLPLAETSPGSKTYKTGIDGIGVRFVNTANTRFPITTFACGAVKNCILGIWNANSYFELVKTAETVTGGTISSSNLPTALYSFGQAGSMVDIYEINFSGSLTLNTPTCDVSPASQSMVVQMGSHKVSAFSGQYTGTAWKNASIRIQNCGWFYGNGSASVATFNGTSNIDVVPLTANKARVTFSFYETPTDPTEGIMALDSTPYSAVGIGIQLSQGPNVSGKFNLNAPVVNYVIPSNGASAWSLPLYARYVQTTTSAPQPGHANGKLEFIISYQ